MQQPQPAGTPSPAPPVPFPEWARTQLERVLRALEGRGPASEARTRRRIRTVLADLEGELPAAPEHHQVCDHLWAGLLRTGLPAAARFFRPAAGRGAPVLWVRRGDGGADALDRRRIHALLGRRSRRAAEDGLDPARIRRLCARQLRNGAGEADLVRALTLTSPGQAAVLSHLCGGAARSRAAKV
ncbi:MAG TPA: hypothetical protein VKA55_03340 [Gammaproteobacteria bacterium]|nr:hypothetical protein [Gammaproteobacteria bacterium]